jgi:hypothetical protein
VSKAGEEAAKAAAGGLAAGVASILEKRYDDLSHPRNALKGLFKAEKYQAWLDRRAQKHEAHDAALLQKIEDIPEDQKVEEPDITLIDDIFEMRNKNIDKDELREMFEALLVSSMTKGQTVHPTMVDIVSRMTSEDALLLQALAKNVKKWWSTFYSVFLVANRYLDKQSQEVEQPVAILDNVFIKSANNQIYVHNLPCCYSGKMAGLGMESLLRLGILEQSERTHIINIKSDDINRFTPGLNVKKIMKKYAKSEWDLFYKGIIIEVESKLKSYRITDFGQDLLEVLSLVPPKHEYPDFRQMRVNP